MSLSAAAISALTAGQTDEIFHMLLDVWIGGTVTYRFTSDAVDTVYNTQTYEPFPFDITLPVDREGQISTMRLRVDNVSQRLIDDIRQQSEAIRVDLSVVLDSDKSLQAQYTHFSWRNLTYDVTSIQGTLTLEGLLNEPFPWQRLTGTGAPGLH